MATIPILIYNYDNTQPIGYEKVGAKILEYDGWKLRRRDRWCSPTTDIK